MADRHDTGVASPAGGAPTRADTAALPADLEALTRLDAAALRAEWRRLYRVHPPGKLSRDLLELGVAWKLQEGVLGGLSAATRRQMAETARTLANKSDPAKARKVSLKPGARLRLSPLPMSPAFC